MEPYRWSPEPIASGIGRYRSRGGLEVVPAGYRAAGGGSRLPEPNPPETPAAPAPVRDGSVPRAHLLRAAAAMLLAAVIADDAPGDPDASAIALERALGLAEPDGVLFPTLARATLGLLERHAEYGRVGAAGASGVTTLLGEASGPAPPGKPAWPGEPLTEGETRVLRYLPTYMGAPEIAAELYLSANTVKTHLRHLYRKLGAHSRREAVQRARAIGLLTASSRRPATQAPPTITTRASSSSAPGAAPGSAGCWSEAWAAPSRPIPGGPC